MKLLSLALATWRLTTMLTKEDGPGDLFASLRDWAGVRYDPTGQAYGASFAGDVLSCFWCCSVWAALALVFMPRWVIGTLAASALAIGMKELSK